MYASKAILGGLVGALLMTAVMAVARLFGMTVNLELMLGSMFTQTTTLGTWLVGLMIHLAAGVAFAFVYAAVFEYVTHRAGWKVGFGIGALHMVFSGVLMAVVPVVHPLIPEVMAAPGPFLANMGGLAVVAFIVLHVMYGAIVGAIYEPITLPHQRQHLRHV